MSFEILPKNFIVYRKPYARHLTLKKAPGLQAFKFVRSVKLSSKAPALSKAPGIDGSLRGNRIYLKDPTVVRRYIGIVKRAKHFNIGKLFLEYTKGTKRLLNNSRIMCYISGGMAVKLHLLAKGKPISKVTENTEDFDFHFISTGERNIIRDTQVMTSMMMQHLTWFSKFLNRKYGFKTRILMRELKGVPVDKAGQGYKYRKVFKVYRFYVLTPTKKIEFADCSLVKEKKSNFEIMHGMYISKYQDLWRDVAYTLTSSFIEPKSYLRNPLIGSKYKKGLKNMSRLTNLVGTNRPKVTNLLTKILNKNIIGSKKAAFSLKRQLNQNRLRHAHFLQK